MRERELKNKKLRPTVEYLKLIISKELRKRNEKKENTITSYSEYGKGENIEIFFDKQNNMMKHGDLKPEDRKLPKDWKKKRWEPPEDPFDPLKDLFKKKK